MMNPAPTSLDEPNLPGTQPRVELPTPDRQQLGALFFIRSKVIIDLALLAYFFLTSSIAGERILPALLFSDLLFLIPYYRIVQQRARAAERATYLSLGISLALVTWLLHATASLLSYQVGWYFLLVLVAGFVLPRVETVWVVAGLGVAAYLVALLAGLTGMVPSSIPTSPETWHVPVLYAVIVILGTVSIAIVAARRITAAEQQQESLARLLEQNRRDLVWGAVGKRMIGAQNLDQVLTVIMQAINQEINVESGSVLLREWDSNQLVFAKILRGHAQHFSSLRLRVGQGIAGWVAQTGQSEIVEDAVQDARWYSGVDRVTGFTTHSILCVPLIAEDETIGVIELLNKFDGAFTTNDRELLEAIATQVAPTIQNKRLQEQMRSAQFPSNELFRQIEHAKQEWEDTVDAIDEGIALVDENCRILRANRILANWINAAPAQLIGRQCFEVLHGDTTMPPTCPHARLLATGIPAEGEVESTVLGKTLRLKAYPIQDETGSRIGSVNVWRDITSEKRLREQLIQSEKMAATGRLVASIAHEINNPLQAVRGCVDLAQSTGDLEKNKRYLGMASTELERLTAIVRRMLDFYRPARAERAPLDLRALIEDVLLLSAKRLQHAHITVHTK